MPNSQLIKLPSRFDYGYHKQFNETCSGLINSGEVTEIILDFTIVEYLDSSALGMLVMMQKKASNSAKKIKIKNVKGATEEILRMANIQKLIEFI
jgi:HptB-dependent secretion and biofilm anti anti-sigma factor